jgi:preprotein translocase subunit SecG
MSILTVCLYAVIFIVALLLIVLILIQPSKSGGMGAAFGGIGESVFGGKAGSHLTKTTVIMTTIFFVAALGLAAVIGHEGAGQDEGLRAEFANNQPAPAGLGADDAADKAPETKKTEVPEEKAEAKKAEAPAVKAEAEKAEAPVVKK